MTLRWLLAVVVVPLLLAEFTECGRWLAERLVRWAARGLRDPEAVAQCEEEWLANLRCVPGKLTPLCHAAWLALTVPRMRRSLAVERRSRRLVVKRSRGLVVGLVGGLAGGLVGGLGLMIRKAVGRLR
ncbi:MAG: hypothetical protein ACRD0K_03550 [Egibacteraceae bacterium]